MIRLMRSHRIHESLLLVFYDWIPKAISGDWQNKIQIDKFIVAIFIYFDNLYSLTFLLEQQ